MTTLEFVEKNLRKAKTNLEKAKQKKNVSTGEIAILEEQIEHYEDIGKLLTADVVEVVRCKGCRHFCPYEGEEHKGDCAELVGLESCVYEDDFCSYGKRKGEGE